MTLEEALKRIETLTAENKKLSKRVQFLEDVMYKEVYEDYDEDDLPSKYEQYEMDID